MKTLRRFWNRLVGTLTGHRHEVELADEFESHVQMLTEDNLRRGMSPGEARRTALLTFGGLELTKESYRDQRGLAWFETLQRDIRFAFRGMRKSPGFTAVALGCMALGIGANTAIFSVINAVMIRSLPVSHPEQLVVFRYISSGDMGSLRRTASGYRGTSFPYMTYEALRKQTQALSGVFAFAPLGFDNHSVTVGMAGQSTVAGGEMVSGNYFSVLGVSPILGRAIFDDDLKPGAPNVVVISYTYWSSEFGGDRSVIGTSVTLNSLPFTVVGVTPPEFFGVNPAFSPDIWVPLREMQSFTPWSRQPSRGQSMFADKGWWWCMMMGRLKPGVTQPQALAEADFLFQQSITEGLKQLPHPEKLPHLVLSPASRGLGNLRRTFSEPLRVLMTAVSLVLLIACANVATLLLVRAQSRQKEMAVRLAMGAHRMRVVRQLLTESVVLSLCGGGLGLLLAFWGSRTLLLLLSNPGQIVSLDVGPDATVLSFCAVVSMVTGSLFGLAPALRATRVDLVLQLKESAGSVSPRLTLAMVLVAGQVALSVLLLFGTGLFVRTLQNLETQDLGFNRNNILLFEIDARRGGYEGDRAVALYNQSLARIQGLPGVRLASVSANSLLSGWVNNSPASPDSVPLPPGQPNTVYWNIVGPGFFETMGIPVVLGRGIGWRDQEANRRVAVINEAMACSFYPAGSPIGRHFCFGDRYEPGRAYEIIGVVRNAKYDSMRDQPPATAYVPYATAADMISHMCFEVRTAADPTAMVSSVREAMRNIDPNLPLIGCKTQSEQIDEALTHERMFAQVSSFFGLLALLLVSVGLYGALAYAVTRRTREIGIRMAMGARRVQVLWMILQQSLVVAAIGLAVGLPAAFALVRFVASLLFGIKTYDSVTIVATIVIVSAVAAVAGILPALRASRIDPIRALHYE